jgi:hypothetical protein
MLDIQPYGSFSIYTCNRSFGLYAYAVRYATPHLRKA